MEVVIISLLIFLVAVLIKAKKDKKPKTSGKVTSVANIPIEKYNVPEGAKVVYNYLLQAIKEGKTSRDLTDEDKMTYDIKLDSDENLKKFLKSMVEVLEDRAAAKVDMKVEMAANRARHFDVNLHVGESIIYNNPSVALYTMQRAFTEVVYGGPRVSTSAYRGGFATINTREVEDLKFKANGQFYITDQRVIFIGEDGDTLSIGLGAILGQRPFEEKGIFLNLENHKPVVFSFYSTGMYNAKLGIVFDDRREAYNLLYAAIHEQ